MRPEIMDETGEATTRELVESFQALGDDQTTAALISHRDVITRCRLTGPAAAVAEASASRKLLPNTGGTPAANILQLLLQGDRALEAQVRYDETGDAAALDIETSTWEAVINHPQFGDTPAIWRLNVLNAAGNSFMARAYESGLPQDRQKALLYWDAAAAQAPRDWPDLPKYLHNKALGRSLNYAESTGSLTDLEEALEASNEAVRSTPNTDPNYPMYVHRLSLILTNRYERTGTLADLEYVIELASEVLGTVKPESLFRPAFLDMLGSSYRRRHLRTRSLDDIRAAVEFQSEAVAINPESAFLNNLGNSLLEFHHYTGDSDSLDRAVGAFRQVVSNTAPSSRFLASRLNNLGNGLTARFSRAGSRADLHEAAQVYEEAIRLTPESDPDLASRLYNLANARRATHALTPRKLKAGRVTQSYRDAVAQGLKYSQEWALAAARNWGQWATERRAWAEASEAYGWGIQVMEHLFRSQINRQDKEAWLRGAQSLPVRAAYAMAKTGDLIGAVTALERGRALLLSEALQLHRIDARQLRLSSHEALYDRWERALERLRTAQDSALEPDPSQPGNAAALASAREVFEEFGEVVDSIRQTPGYERFLDSPTYDDIREAAREGPLIYLIATDAGGLALAINPASRPEIKAIWLRSLTEESIRQMLLGSGAGPPGGYLGAAGAQPGEPGSTVDAIGSWLWRSLMDPVLKSLGKSIGPDCRAYLVPCGLLGLTPLHAAWKMDRKRPTGRLYALDLAPIVYTPNARALVAARESAATLSTNSILSIQDPQPVNAPKLWNAGHEQLISTCLFQDSLVLREEEATRDRVLAALQECSVVHFACHGYSSIDNPLLSGLPMAHDELLSAADLLSLRYSATRLAILSACETGVPGVTLPDEVIGLPTCLLQSGVSGVLSSLWSVSDRSAVMLMARFYELWRKEGMEPADALRESQRWLRDTTNGEKADYFKGFLPEFGGGWMAPEAADALYKAIVLSPPGNRDFADPLYWAAFSYTGV